MPFKALSNEAVPVMSGPASASAVLMEIPKDAEVNIIDERFVNGTEKWYKISYKRRLGWLRCEKVTEIEKPDPSYLKFLK